MLLRAILVLLILSGAVNHAITCTYYSVIITDDTDDC